MCQTLTVYSPVRPVHPSDAVICRAPRCVHPWPCRHAWPRSCSRQPSRAAAQCLAGTTDLLTAAYRCRKSRRVPRLCHDSLTALGVSHALDPAWPCPAWRRHRYRSRVLSPQTRTLTRNTAPRANDRRMFQWLQTTTQVVASSNRCSAPPGALFQTLATWAQTLRHKWRFEISCVDFQIKTQIKWSSTTYTIRCAMW